MLRQLIWQDRRTIGSDHYQVWTKINIENLMTAENSGGKWMGEIS